MRHVLFAAAALALAAVPVAAQQPMAHDTARHRAMAGHMAAGGMGGAHAGGMSCGMMQGGMGHDSAMGGMGGMMEGMMREMAQAPEHLLARKAALGLTPDQQRSIAAIRDAARAPHDAAMATAMHHQQEIDDVMRTAAPDTAAITHHFAAAHAAMGQAHLVMLQAAAQARAVLTDAQRHQADSTASAMDCGAMGAAPAGQPAHRH